MSGLLHEYQDVLFRNGRSPSVILQGARDFIEHYISEDELCLIFGGYIISCTGRPEQQFLGIWGIRKASRFRRLLRERGALFEVEHHDAPPFTPKIISRTPGGIQSNHKA